jgi:NitT/TauT family transport system substrate-binding protein
MRAPRCRAGALAAALLLLAAACANAPTPARDAAPRDSAPRDVPASTLPAAPPDGASSGPPHPLSLRLSLGNNVLPLIPNSVLWLARDLGYYEREGLDVELVELNGTPLAMAALVSGQADVANVGVPEAIDLVASNKADVRAINSSDARQYFLLATAAEVSTAADLRGKSFGVARVGSVDYTQSLIVLRGLGLDPTSDLTFLGVGDPSTRARALVAGNVQAATFSVATWLPIRHEPGVRVLVDPSTFYRAVPVIAKTNVATSEAIQNKPEELARFTRAVVAASRHFARHEGAWVDAVLRRRPDLDRAELSEAWQQFDEGWAVNGLLNLGQYADTTRFLYTSGALPDLLPVDRWTTTVFVDQALADLGVYPGLDDPGRTIPAASRPQ